MFRSSGLPQARSVTSFSRTKPRAILKVDNIRYVKSHHYTVGRPDISAKFNDVLDLRIGAALERL